MRRSLAASLSTLLLTVTAGMLGGILPAVAHAQSLPTLRAQGPGEDTVYTYDIPHQVGGWAAIRRALLGVFGRVTDTDQLDKPLKDQSLVYRYYEEAKSPKDIAWIRSAGPGVAYLPVSITDHATIPNTDPNDPDYPNPKPACDVVQFGVDNQFSRDCAAVSRQRGIGRVAMLRESAFSLADSVDRSLTATFVAGGGRQPKFTFDRIGGQTAGPTPIDQSVRIPLGEVNSSDLAAASLGPQKVTAGTVGALTEAVQGVDLRRGTPLVTDVNADAQVCVPGPGGTRVCSGHAASALFSHEQGGAVRSWSAVSAGSLDAGLEGIRQGLGRYVGTSAQVPSAKSLVRGSATARARFTPQSTARLAEATATDTIRQEAACNPATATLSRDQVVARARTLGLLPSDQPWLPFYRSASALQGLQALDLKTQALVTVGAGHVRPPTPCVWVVMGPPQTGGGKTYRELALISDTSDPSAPAYHLLAQELFGRASLP